jgi:tyrosinase
LPLPIGCDNVHGTPYFLPWHRAYLYFFERALRYRVERAMLAWWDWRTGPQRPAQLPQAFRARTVDGQGNPLHSARVSGSRWSRAGERVYRSRPAPGANRATRRCCPGRASRPPTKPVAPVTSARPAINSRQVSAPVASAQPT